MPSLDNTTDSEAFYRLGRVLYDQGRLSYAVSTLEDAVSIAPNNSGAWISLAQAHYEQRHYQKAISAFERVLEIDPNNTLVREYIALIHRIMGLDNKEKSIAIQQAA